MRIASGKICVKYNKKNKREQTKKQKNEIKTAKKETELIIFKNGRYAIFTIYIIYYILENHICF